MAVSCTGIVLAAGSSLRMGQPKQLLSLEGRPLLEHVVAECACDVLDKTEAGNLRRPAD